MRALSKGLGGLITGGIFFFTGRWTYNWSGAYRRKFMVLPIYLQVIRRRYHQSWKLSLCLRKTPRRM